MEKINIKYYTLTKGEVLSKKVARAELRRHRYRFDPFLEKMVKIDAHENVEGDNIYGIVANDLYFTPEGHIMVSDIHSVFMDEHGRWFRGYEDLNQHIWDFFVKHREELEKHGYVHQPGEFIVKPGEFQGNTSQVCKCVKFKE